MTLRIAITGDNGAGKTTIADYLVSKGFVEVCFATTLKEVTSNILGVPLALLEGREFREERENRIIEPWNLTGRQALIAIGEMFRDHFNEDTWILTADRAIRVNSERNIVVSDVRKDNEKKYLLANGFTIVTVVREGQSRSCNSDSALLQDSVLVNDSTKEELYRKVDALLNTLTS